VAPTALEPNTNPSSAAQPGSWFSRWSRLAAINQGLIKGDRDL